MGEWNGTCGISQLPIYSGEEIWAFLIGVRRRTEAHQSGYCYPTDLGFPMSLPIKGYYNDYGGIEGIKEDYNTKLILESYGGKIKNIETFLNDCIERNQFFLEGEYIGKYGVGLFMILSKVAEDLKSVKSKDNKDTAYNIAKKDAEFFFERAPQIYNKNKEFCFMSIEDYVFSMNKYQSINKYYNTFVAAFHNTTILEDNMKPYCEYIIRLINKDKDIKNIEVQNLIEGVADFHCISSILYSLRKSWTPQSGKGSQREELEFYSKLISSMKNNIADKRRK